MHFVVVYYDESSVSEAKSVTCGEGLRAFVTFF